MNAEPLVQPLGLRRRIAVALLQLEEDYKPWKGPTVPKAPTPPDAPQGSATALDELVGMVVRDAVGVSQEPARRIFKAMQDDGVICQDSRLRSRRVLCANRQEPDRDKPRLAGELCWA